MDKEIDWEKGYYVGQEYIEDPEKIEALIKFSIKSAIAYENFNLDLSKDLHIRQGNGVIYVNLHKTISKRLFIEIKGLSKDSIEKSEKAIRAGNFILGYIRKVVPAVEEEIFKKKYLEGHILSGSFSMVDIFDVVVLDKTGDGGVVIWPIPVKAFPTSKLLASDYDAIFIHDLIDSMTLYFGFNPDESIRKIISSLENFFIHYNIRILDSTGLFATLSKYFSKKAKLPRLIKYFINVKHYQYKERNLRILRENILYIYSLRNLIVHDKLRIKRTKMFMCKKGIGSLLYIFQANIIESKRKSYIFSLYQQFLMLEDHYNGIDPDSIKDRHFPKNIMSSLDDLDNFMFDGLRISRKDKRMFKTF